MALYGIDVCLSCISYGIKLTPAEKIDIVQQAKRGVFIAIQRDENSLEQCPTCGGTGWVFVPNLPGVILPNNVWKRWS